MLILKTLASKHLELGTFAILLVASLQCQVGIAFAQGRTEWQSSQQTTQQPTQNDPTVVRPAGFNLQASAPQTPLAPQPIVQPNGQRIFNQNTNNPQSNTPPSFPNNGQSTGMSAPAANDIKSAVQPASWTSDSPSIPTKAVATGANRSTIRAPLELKPSTKDKGQSLDKPSSTWAATLSMFFSLSIVLCFFLLVAWLIKKAQPTSFLKLPNDVVQVMGRTPMAPRQQMYVVRFGSKLLLISHQPGQTQTLGEITDADEVQRLAGLCEANHPGSISNSFRDVLKQVTLGKTEAAPKRSLRMSRSE